MKKIFTLIMTVFVLLTVLCINAFATTTTNEDVVLRVSALKRDDTTVVLNDYTVFEDGWNKAMELAINSKELNDNDYARVIVDIYADWNAVEGQFTEDFFNGKGFNWDAIYFQPNVKMTLNLNNNTINRGITIWEYNGEVMYIDKGADVIINEGTITGGFSGNGAGGIHINGANVVLNNVHIVKNYAEDANGAGIALHNGATLTMQNGSIVNNEAEGFGGGIYLKYSEAYLNEVNISDNAVDGFAAGQGHLLEGGACQVNRSTLYLTKCIIKNNYSSRYGGAIGIDEGDVVIEECTITENYALFEGSAISISKGTCLVDKSSIVGNRRAEPDGKTVFTYGSVFYVEYGTLQFSNSEYDEYFECWESGVVLFADVSETPVTPGSIFGEGSFTTIISFVALITSIASIGVTIFYNKKKETLSNTEE